MHQQWLEVPAAKKFQAPLTLINGRQFEISIKQDAVGNSIKHLQIKSKIHQMEFYVKTQSAEIT